jgi:uracil-DNA glycosylase family 4
MVVVGAPGHGDADYGRLMHKFAMKVFMRCMDEERFVREDFYYYPAVRCPHDPDKFTTKEKSAAAKCCRGYFEEEVKRLKPEVILPMGAEAAKQVFGRAVKITKIRGVAEQFNKRTMVLPMLNPMQVALYPQHEPTFRSDCATLGRLVDNNYDVDAAVEQTLGSYEYVDDLNFLIDRKNAGEFITLAFDTEGTSLRWFAPDSAILTMQFAVKPGEAYMLAWDHPDKPRSNRWKKQIKNQLEQLLCDPKVKVVGQNLKYDAGMMLAHTGLRIPIGGDTLMLATLLDENAITKNLDDLAKRYVPDMAGYADRFNLEVDKSKMIELPLDNKFLDYGCGDADCTLRLHDVLYAEVAKDPKLLAHYEHVSIPGLNALVGIESRGLYVDEAYVDEFETFMEGEVKRQYESLLRQVPRSIRRKHIEKGLKFSRKEFVLDILFNHEDGFRLTPKVFTKTTAKLDEDRKVPSTSSKDHLPYFFDTCPFTFELAEYVKQERILGTNVKGFKAKYIVDGMVRPTYALHRTVTGRTSSEDPNGQNFPKRGAIAKAYRKLFVAPEGYFILECDLSQAELRIAGDMANDPTMIKIYREEGDIHTYTALIVMQVTMEEFLTLPKDEQKAARTKAKAVNFGFLYGMGWRKFIAYAKTQYGVEFSEKEAKRIRAEFFERYFKLPEWHKKMREFVREHQFVRSYSGRIRHLPMIESGDEGIQAEAERQAINSPVQEFGSSLGVMACGRMDSEVDESYLALVGFVHDAIYAYVPKQYIEWGAKTMAHYMETNPLEEWFNRKMKLPIVADASIGENLGETYELGKFDRCDEYGECEVGTYDFGQFWDKEKKSGLIVPRQRIPPNNGRLVEPRR